MFTLLQEQIAGGEEGSSFFAWLSFFLVLSYQIVLVTTLVIIVLRKREPSSALAWSLAVTFLPLLGMILFYSIGITKVPFRLKRKVLHRSVYEEKCEDLPEGVFEGAPIPWRGICHLAESLGEAPRRRGNQVELLGRGALAFERMFASIVAAKHHVHVQTFIFRNDGLGNRLLALLMQKAREGVEVRLVVDSVGTLLRFSILQKLQKAGGEAYAFMPIIGKRFMPNLRNHRKIVVVDGEVGFFGGLNVGEEYLGRFMRRGRGWCDLHFELRGPSVADLQAVFAEDWHFCSNKLLTGQEYFPRLEPVENDAPLQIVSGGPDQDVNAIRQAFFATISRARKKLWIASPYVVPDLAVRTALLNAALRGVEVTLLTQGSPPDKYMVAYCGQSYFEELMAAGVRVYRYGAGMMHAKMILADDDWAVVGSANLDNRSLFLNFEVVALLDGEAGMQPLRERFMEELSQAEEIDRQKFAERPGWKKVLERGARLFSPMM
ncbi:MAG: cardiolipin synthase [Planctomycetota bacterium]|jgi:cardiolipin synthase